MTVVAVFEVDVDPSASPEAMARYESYRMQVPALVERFGGRYLVRAGSGRAMEGPETTARWHVIEFPDADSADAFWTSDAYAAVKPLREGAATVRAIVISPP